MAEWLVEEGIGEHRAIRLEGDRIVAARVAWPGELAAGHIEDAVLISRAAGSARGTARFAGGEEALVDKLPRSATEGARIRLEVTRPALGERARRKLARARPSEGAPRPAPSIAERLQQEGNAVRVVHAFPAGDFAELMAEAFSGHVAFPGGSLQFSPTPAMLLVDVDGALDPRSLALAAVAPLAEALQRFDVGGPVGIDFPTLADKPARRAVDDALAHALADWPHERTAMNGFGFVQLVARLVRPSLLHRAAFQPAATAARMALRQAEGLQGAGAIELSGHPSLAPEIEPFVPELERRSGREVRWRADAALAVKAPHAQLVPR